MRDDLRLAEELVGDRLLLLSLMEIRLEVSELALDSEVGSFSSTPVGSAVVAVHVTDEERGEIESVLKEERERRRRPVSSTRKTETKREERNEP